MGKEIFFYLSTMLAFLAIGGLFLGVCFIVFRNTIRKLLLRWFTEEKAHQLHKWITILCWIASIAGFVVLAFFGDRILGNLEAGINSSIDNNSITIWDNDCPGPGCPSNN